MSSDPNERSKLLVRYRNQLFDLTTFASKHPGGRNTLSGALESDIDYKFDEAVPHSDAAHYLINEYRVPDTAETNNNDHETAEARHTKMSPNETAPDGNGSNILELDESLEVNECDWPS